MPWIAFVPDISGVCSNVGTFEITSKPRKIASTRIVSSKTSSAPWLMSAPAPARRARPLVVRFGAGRAGASAPGRPRPAYAGVRPRRASGSCCHLLAGHARAGDDLVVPVENELAVAHDQSQECGDVAREELAGVRRH